MSDEKKVAAGQMLPGIAGICMYLIFMTIVNAFAALQGRFGEGGPKYGVLAVCTLLAVGIFGLLRLKKWGWALVAAACMLLSVGYLFIFSRLHAGFFLVQGLFSLVFFLYLVRTEVRERLR
ncbi:hypothetical protein EDE15_2776 [Edaphobacter aggregans]|jgi:hypothetical protein|uniref:Uncharacterized protein n=1 Tax=Edaphobacter aggregans TaxID=570835 RepID=A0A3R9WHD2_9BACT|nr:hypothetical protein [Edaphobacter aggregans]RSL17246.1 hypothetical protein EDE15_2776 [Edaphobacter aggregans]